MVKYSKTQEQSVQFKSNPLKHKNSVSETARQNKVSETFRQGPLLLKPNSRTIPACSCGKIFQTTGSYLPKINHPLKHKLSVSETARQNKVSETCPTNPKVSETFRQGPFLLSTTSYRILTFGHCFIHCSQRHIARGSRSFRSQGRRLRRDNASSAPHRLVPNYCRRIEAFD